MKEWLRFTGKSFQCCREFSDLCKVFSITHVRKKNRLNFEIVVKVFKNWNDLKNMTASCGSFSTKKASKSFFLQTSLKPSTKKSMPQKFKFIAFFGSHLPLKLQPILCEQAKHYSDLIEGTSKPTNLPKYSEIFLSSNHARFISVF